MKFLANMGISLATVEFLRNLGHEAVHLHEEGLDRLPDPDILRKARREGYVLLTNDLDFGELLAHGGEALPSVVIFRLSNMRPESVNRHLAEVIEHFSTDLEQGVIASVADWRIRIRRLPIEKKGGADVKTTLIYAGIAGYGFRSLGKGMEAGWINHGLAQLAACAKAEGFEVDLIDLRGLESWEHFRQVLAERDPDVVGLTMMSVDYNPVMKAIDVIKDVNPSIIVVVGGPHPTLVLEEVVANPKIDYIVTHEAEISFPRLLGAIERGQPPKERVIRGERPDLDSLPFVDRELFLDEWRRCGYDLDSPEVPFVPELPPPFLTIIAGRGCIYNCSFCQPAERIIFGKFRQRSVGSVIEELKLLRDKYHFASFMFHDDCLTNDREWVAEFCEAYKREGFTQPFSCQSRADIIVRHEELVEMMADAGCKLYFIGFESGSDRVLRFLRKGTTREINLKAARICKKYGISIWANYMLGIPTETKEEVMETISMLKEIDPDYYSPAFYTPHPGSDLYTYCIENDLSLITSHDQYRRNPTETKIKGQDPEFLNWALVESQRRKPRNAFKRWARRNWKRYANLRKAWRKAKRLAGFGVQK